MDRTERQRYFLGVDIGSSSTKGVVVDDESRIVSKKTIRTKPKHREGFDIILRLLKEDLDGDLGEKGGPDPVSYCVGTGYGRNNVHLAQNTVTEISCHAKGVHYYFPGVKTIIDIGGQDSKVIRVDEKGEVVDFAMNEKCAAGTGRFWELVSKIFKIPFEDFGPISLGAKSKCKISSTCIVFAESEIISKLAEGVENESILKGMHSSIVARILGMGRRIGVEPPIAFTGGVAENIGIVRELVEQGSFHMDDILIPEDPKVAGALGAALFAREEYENRNPK